MHLIEVLCLNIIYLENFFVKPKIVEMLPWVKWYLSSLEQYKLFREGEMMRLERIDRSLESD